MNGKLWGLVLMLISCLSFSVMQVCVRISAAEIPLVEQVFFRNALGLLISIAVLKYRRISPVVDPEYKGALFARALSGFAGLFFLFYASSHARQADVSLLSRTTCIWVFLIQAFMGVKMRKTQAAITCLCIAGAVIAINPRFDSAVIPLLCACASAMCSGAAYTAIGYCSGRVDPFVVIFYFCLFSTVCAGILMLWNFTVPSRANLLWVIMIGLSAAAGQVTLTYGLQKVTAGIGSVYEYFTIIASALLGYLFFAEIPGLRTIIGSILIIAGAVWNYRESRILVSG